MLKLWLDDIRLPPDDSWKWCKTVRHACIMLEGRNISQEEIIVSFDHDLGDDEQHGTGYDLAKYFEGTAGSGKIFNVIEWHIHSANPVGRANIQKAMESFDRIRKSES